MGVCIVYGRSMVGDLSYSVIQTLQRCQFKIEHLLTSRSGSLYESRECITITMSRALELVSGYSYQVVGSQYRPSVDGIRYTSE